MIKTVIFDYAGVLTPTRDKYQFAQKYAKDFGLDTASLLKILYQDWDKACINQISSTTFWQGIADQLNINPDKLKAMVIDTFPLDPRMIELVDQIHKTHTTMIISNQIKDWLEKVIKENHLKDKFDYIIGSYEVKLKKPDKRIYKIALEKSGCMPEEALFIDDNYNNIAAAKKLGLEVISFKNFKQFKQEFDQYLEE